MVEEGRRGVEIGGGIEVIRGVVVITLRSCAVLLVRWFPAVGAQRRTGPSHMRSNDVWEGRLHLCSRDGLVFESLRSRARTHHDDFRLRCSEYGFDAKVRRILLFKMRYDRIWMQGLIYKKTNKPSNKYQPPLTLSTKCFVYSVTLHRPYIARTVTSPTLFRLSWARSKVLRREVGQKPGTDLSGITLRQSMYVCTVH